MRKRFFVIVTIFIICFVFAGCSLKGVSLPWNKEKPTDPANPLQSETVTFADETEFTVHQLVPDTLAHETTTEEPTTEEPTTEVPTTEEPTTEEPTTQKQDETTSIVPEFWGEKSVDEIVREVIIGKWGNGRERKNRLNAAGYDYRVVQAEVNRVLGYEEQPID